MFTEINLPKPSEKLINLIKTVAAERPTNFGGKAVHDAVQQVHRNNAAGEFFKTDEVTKLALSEYQRYFYNNLIPMIGLLRNTKTGVPAGYAPHSDRIRNVAINFYIDLGGSNVSTVFYDKYDPDNDLVGGYNAKYEDLTKVGEYFCNDSTWYVFNSRQYHSVENIETTRVMMSLSLIGVNAKNIHNVMKNLA
jgi:hypothetical protein